MVKRSQTELEFLIKLFFCLWLMAWGVGLAIVGTLLYLAYLGIQKL
jgi:hypothetical protein